MKKTKSIEGRTLPHSIEGEQCVLGCVLIDQDASYSILSDLKPNDFYVEAHKIIFENMCKIFNANQPVDFVTLCDQLEKVDLTDSIGGVEYLTLLTEIVPSASNYKHYVDIVKNGSVLRKLISASQEIINGAYDGLDKSDAIALAESNIYSIAEKEDSGGLNHISDSLNRVIEKFEIIQKDKNALRGIPSGFYGLDKITNGFQKSDLVLIAARPGCGKTSFGMNVITNACIKYHKKAAIFSLEMSKDQIMQRAICSVGFVDMSKALRGELADTDWKSLWVAKDKLNDAQIFVDEGFSKTPAELISKCKRLKREKGLDIVMIDYLQLMNSGSKGKDLNRQQEISEITRTLKMAARELEVPILLLSQLSRNTEGRTNHKPMLSDLRESGAIEQDADIVLFIYNPSSYEDNKGKEGVNDDLRQLIIAKHRNGALGEINLKWVGNTTTFFSSDKDANIESIEGTEPNAKKPKNSSNNDDAPLPPEPMDDENQPSLEPIKDELDEIF